MERDFLGLGTIAAPITVKEDSCDDSRNPGPAKSSGMQLSFSNNVSAIPQFLSFKPAQEDRLRKIVHEPIVSSGHMSMANADAFDSNQKAYSGVAQNMIHDKQVGNNYAMSTYALQHLIGNQAGRTQEVRMFPVPSGPNQTITGVSSPGLHSHLPSTEQNVAGGINPHPLGAVSVISPVSVIPGSSSILGTTELRNTSKPNGAPSQLIIFYNGSVCVYDNVSPQKAQAIMLVAGNGLSSVTQNTTVPATAQVQESIPRPSIDNGFVRNNSHTTAPCFRLQSSISVTSHVGSQPAGLPSCTNDLAMVKLISVIAPSNNQLEPAKAVGSVGSASALVPAVAVPQAPRASLARFLEKRRERVLSTSPYNVTKKTPDSSSA